MATINVTSNYAGDSLKKYMLEALVGGETLSTPGISVETGIKYKRTIKKMGVGSILQPGTCEFSPSSGLTVTNVVLEPKKFKVNESICFEDVYNLWDSADMAAGDNNEQMPTELVTAIVDSYKNKVSETIETVIWQGDNTLDVDGWESILATGGVTGTTSAFTASNIMTYLNAAYNAIPAAVIKKPKDQLVIFVSQKAASMYLQNLAAQGVAMTNSDYVLNLYGIEVKPVNGLTSDYTIVIGERPNFFFGTDLASDYNEVKILDQRDVDGSDKINFVLKGKIDCKVAEPNEVVYHTV